MYVDFLIFFMTVYFIRFETMYRNLGNKPLDHHGAWWYGTSVKSNLNGKYFNQEVNNNDGMFWHGWNQHKSLKTARMMIREGASCKSPD